VPAVALAPLLPAEQVQVELSPAAPVFVNMLIDPFVADAQRCVQGQPARKLLGTPVQFNQFVDRLPVCGADPAALPAAPPPQDRLLRQLGTVRRSPAVAPQFTADCRTAAPKMPCDAALAEACAPQCVVWYRSAGVSCV
jgi:hypothetical protein